MTTHVRKTLALASFALAAALGCEGAPEDPSTGVILSLSEVPADVACVRVTAASEARTAARLLDVVGGMPFQETLSGMPLGTVTFRAEAFPGPCIEVKNTTIPTWVSDPDTVAIALGHLTSVTLTMHRNGRAKVGVDFADEPACTAPGLACISDTECCSGDCSKYVCQPPSSATDGGASDGGTDGP